MTITRHITKKTPSEMGELLEFIKTSADLLNEGIERDGEPMVALEIQTDSGPMIVIVAGGKLVAETKEALGFGSAKAHWQEQGTPVKAGEKLPMLETFVRKNL
jgi:hypothetical protein